jgi:hypothetical protein
MTDENHDSPEVVLINSWLDTLSEPEAWWLVVRYWWRVVITGGVRADAWLLDSATDYWARTPRSDR